MDTRYIGPLNAETRERGRFRAELQAETSDGATGPLLELRLHNHSSATEIAAVEMERAAALELRDALNTWLAEDDTNQAQGIVWTRDALQQLNEPQVREIAVHLGTPGQVRMGRAALIEAICERAPERSLGAGQ